ncbi:ABC transporter ATP-binding protein [Candidatus Peregrinibacteria bacterium]|nr:ABC transporter ATP-binding protein [Candidatus Peregrinibacteria bacterium]
MLHAKNIHKAFGGVKALQGVTLTIQPKCITALIGPNGAGKTTLFDIINGLIAPDTGELFLEKENMTRLPSHIRAQRGISRTWQAVRLFKHLTMFDHLRMAENNEDTNILKNIFLFSKKQTHTCHPEVRGNAQHCRASKDHYELVLQKFGIDRSPQTLVSHLSYGQRKLLQLAMVSLQPHKILLLDEPVAGVNQVVQAHIENVLLKLKDEGETICIIEHDMEFVQKIADHTIVMDAGRVLMEGSPREVLKDKMVLEAYLGE